MRAVIISDLGNVGRPYFLVTRRRHLQRGGKIRPQLKSMRAPYRVSLGHLLVNDSTSGSHPLNVAGIYRSAISNAVGMIYTAGEHIADGFDTAMWMPGESGLVIFGNVAPKVVEQQKRVELLGGSETESAVEMHSRTFERRL